uniref:Uncharacterized protein n=1 Tax=Ditylenchus dipsaci TaxID=166011 RepID=A0A915DU95_9BILA
MGCRCKSTSLCQDVSWICPQCNHSVLFKNYANDETKIAAVAGAVPGQTNHLQQAHHISNPSMMTSSPHHQIHKQPSLNAAAAANAYQNSSSVRTSSTHR